MTPPPAPIIVTARNASSQPSSFQNNLSFTENHMELYIITHETYTKFRFHCPELKPYWNTVMLTCLHVATFTLQYEDWVIVTKTVCDSSLCAATRGALQIRTSSGIYSLTALQMPCVLPSHSIVFINCVTLSEKKNMGFRYTFKAQWSVDYFIKLDLSVQYVYYITDVHTDDTIAMLYGYRTCHIIRLSTHDSITNFWKKLKNFKWEYLNTSSIFL